MIGATSAVQVEQKSNQEKLYDNMLLQTEKIVEQHDNWSGWGADMHKFPGTINQNGNFMDNYERNIPVRFQGDSAEDGYYPVDTFTQNMLNKYAVEGVAGKKFKDPRPTGAFYLTKESAMEAAKEVICTHFKKCDAEGEKFLKLYYNEAWDYYDVNRVGRIDAVGVSQFFRHLTRPLGMIDLQ